MKKLLTAVTLIAVFLVYAFLRRDNAVAEPAANGTPNNPQPVATNNSSSTQSQSPAQVPTTTTPSNTAQYKDGTYTGSVEDAYYGNVQVKAIISGGQITDVQFLQYPNDRETSRLINSQAIPMLTQQAIQAQSANVNGVSGATDTSMAFQASLTNALNQAH